MRYCIFLKINVLPESFVEDLFKEIFNPTIYNTIRETILTTGKYNFILKPNIKFQSLKIEE